ncbi:hypothetical protein PC129_g21757 [Phytophthora cactorum]|uniref:Uncharacterized protein n=2 Tax=Phytophthora cactorum TaxID=29920 RepID=A0A8T1H4W7_9STRA|nr:hypothetical protein PC128_g25058 [Phytophthora cactorum]KAG3206411.1 hypothetical protein PC129_g21757 [Phytophthora cactorum]
MNGTNLTSAISYTTGITPGTASPSKAVVLNSNSSISGIALDGFLISASGSCPEFTIQNNSSGGGFDSGLRIAPATQNALMYSNMGFWTPAYNSCYLHMSSYNQTCVHTRPLSNADCNANMPSVSLCNRDDVIHRRAVMITANALTSSNNYAPVCKLQITSDTTFQDGQYNRALRICNANFTNSMEIQIENAASGAVFIGSTTSSALKSGTGNSTKMTLTTDGRLGIGTTSPRAGLEVIGTYT